MAEMKIITSKHFRLWDVTKKEIYLPNITLEKIAIQYTPGLIPEYKKSYIFYLKEQLFYDKEELSYLLNLKNETIISIIHGICQDPRIYAEGEKIASFRVYRIRQVDISNIMAMGSMDVGVVNVLAQVGVSISEEDIDIILRSMDKEDG